jgi:hypothetical protein
MKQAKTFIHPANKLEILRRRIAARAQKPSNKLSYMPPPPRAAEPTAQGSMS